MAATAFTLWQSQVFSAPTSPAPVAGVPFVLASSSPVTNGPTPSSSVLINLEYEQITPDITAGSAPFAVVAVVESQDDAGKWNPIAYQFSEFRDSGNPTKRIIRLQPDISDFNAGIDDSIYVINRELARISRQQGKLPSGASFRVCLIVVDNEPAGANKFQSLKISGTGERYDHF